METKLENWSSSFLLWTSSSPFEKKSTSSYKQHHSLPLLAPKAHEQKPNTKPKTNTQSGIDFSNLFTSVFFFLLLVQFGLVFFFIFYPLFLVESGFVPCWIWAIICVCIWALKELSTCKIEPTCKKIFLLLLRVLQMCNILSPKHKSSVLVAKYT